MRSVNAQVECLLREALAARGSEAEGAGSTRKRGRPPKESEVNERRSRMVRAEALRLRLGLADQLAGLGCPRLFIGGVIAAPILLHGNAAQTFATIAILLVLFILITARTTRGGWKWRWGEEE